MADNMNSILREIAETKAKNYINEVYNLGNRELAEDEKYFYNELKRIYINGWIDGMNGALVSVTGELKKINDKAKSNGENTDETKISYTSWINRSL